MKSLGSVLRTHFASHVVLPDRTQCPGCKRFNTADAEVQALMREAGKPLHLAERPEWLPCSLGAGCKATVAEAQEDDNERDRV